MDHKYRRQPTKQMIIQTGTKFYLEQGFTNTSNRMICKALDISNGQLTFHFPTKEHLLAVLVEELCDFQWKIMKEAAEKGDSFLMACCLELAAMTAICSENPIYRDFYVSAYIHPTTQLIIHKNETKRAIEVFAQFCPDWTEENFRQVAKIIVGIEMSTLMMAANDEDSLETKITHALDSIMLLFRVPESYRKMKIAKVLDMDYKEIGYKIINDFMQYVDTINTQVLEEAWQTKQP